MKYKTVTKLLYFQKKKLKIMHGKYFSFNIYLLLMRSFLIICIIFESFANHCFIIG